MMHRIATGPVLHCQISLAELHELHLCCCGDKAKEHGMQENRKL